MSIAHADYRGSLRMISLVTWSSANLVKSGSTRCAKRSTIVYFWNVTNGSVKIVALISTVVPNYNLYGL